MVAIGCEAFHKSATYGIESKLISCLLADGKYELQNLRQTSESFTMHNYFEKRYYESTLFGDIWNQLMEADIVQKSLVETENSDVFKLSTNPKVREASVRVLCCALHRSRRSH